MGQSDQSVILMQVLTASYPTLSAQKIFTGLDLNMAEYFFFEFPV